MSYLRIGSGDTSKLLSGLGTKGYADLWRKFLAENSPHYNAYASPIDALRTGAILEDQYLKQCTPDNCLAQKKFTHAELNVFVSSVDFTFIEAGKVSTFEELKSIWLDDFINIIKPLSKLSNEEQIAVLKKKFKGNYNQVQFQLNCSRLDSAKLVFLSVNSYEDDFNFDRTITENEVVKFEIPRDEEVIALINERGELFQKVKDNFKK